MEILVGTVGIELGAEDTAALDGELRRRDYDSPASQRLREALEREQDGVSLRNGELGELALALHALSADQQLSAALGRLREALSDYFGALEHGS